MFWSRFLPCSECGESVERTAEDTHTCDRERLLEYQMFGLRHDVAVFEPKLREYLDTGAGRFEMWLAARQIQESAQ